MHRILLALFLAFALHGCAISPAVIKSDTLAFGEVIEETTNKLLVMNLLRARDKAPLHFADIPLMRESMQQSFSFSWLNFIGAARAPPSTRDSIGFGASVQKTPSFDLNHLHSKDFITGISSPIDPKIVKYWIDRGLDRRLVLLLFFSGVEIVERHSENGPATTIRIANSPRDAVDIIKARTTPFTGSEALLCDRQSDFERYLKLLNKVRTFFAHNYRERRLIAGSLKSRAEADGQVLQALTAVDSARIQVAHDRERATYSLYSVSGEQKVAFCFYDPARSTEPASAQYEFIESGRESGADRRNCYQSVVDVGAEDASRRVRPFPVFFSGAADVQQETRYCGIYNRFSGIVQPPPAQPGGYPRRELRLFIRSVGEIFQFLGDLLYYQEELRRHLDANPQLALKLNTPVTFGYCGDIPEPGCDNIFIRLDGDPCNARFSLTYREREYHVGNFDPGSTHGSGAGCRPEPSARKDHTIEILSVLHQLVGLNKSASDVRSTTSVQVLP